MNLYLLFFLCSKSYFWTLENVQIYLLGFAAQSLFGSRLIIQWWQSEKKGEVVSPTIFWYLSLGGSLLFLIYGLIRVDPVVILGQFISYYIYVRNLQLKNAWTIFRKSVRAAILILPVLSIAGFMLSSRLHEGNLANVSLANPIMIIGTIGQLALNFRFVYQWYYAEKFKTSVLPFGFWNISTWASVMVIVYSLFHPVHRVEPVLLISQSLGIIVYIRNMILSRPTKEEIVDV